MAAEQIAKARTEGVADFEWMAKRKNGEEFPVEVRLRRLASAQKSTGSAIIAVVRDMSERKRLEHEKRLHLSYLEAMDKVSRAIGSTLDVDTMLAKAIDSIREIFGSDRAWLVFPCDPNASVWSVPVESSNQQYPGVSDPTVQIPMDPSSAAIAREALDAKGPVVYGPHNPIPCNPDWQNQFTVHAQMDMAIHPKIGSPWLLGLHECVTARVWSAEEQRLFKDIGCRITDALNNVLFHRDLKVAYQRLSETQSQLLQSEKLASIGQLAAGVAHEINNPVGYVSSNISTMHDYLDDLAQVLDAYEKAEDLLPQGHPILKQIHQVKRNVDLDYVRQDMRDLLNESKEGVVRVKQIVQDLKDFSRVDQMQWQWSDIHSGLESTLNIVWNELKYKAEVVKEYGALPEIQCVLSQLNQVFMNLLVNAAQAIEERGTITVRTGVQEKDWVWVEVADTGKGIEKAHLDKIFDPFFTTKPVGKGTGLGLSLSFSIVRKHGGHITVDSEPGKGTTFRICLPVSQGDNKGGAVASQTV
jgi:signal transduction histidine kinase